MHDSHLVQMIDSRHHLSEHPPRLAVTHVPSINMMHLLQLNPPKILNYLSSLFLTPENGIIGIFV